MKGLREKNRESVSSILPVFAIVLLLSISLVPLGGGIVTLFLFGTILLILGMSLFTLGSEMSMQPLGEGIGLVVGRAKRLLLPLLCFLILGMLVTIAEPDLQVLAGQIPAVPNLVLIWAVAVGVGVFLMLALCRAVFNWKLTWLLWIFYPLLFLLAVFAPKEFLAAAFDSGGVTTGPITVPFLMALGAGLATSGKNSNKGEGEFGLISLCSIGPILSVLLLSIGFRPEASAAATEIPAADTTQEAFFWFLAALQEYGKEVLLALSPIIGVFVLFQAIFRRYRLHQIVRIFVGLLYTYIGLVIFLTGANAGFLPVGQLLGAGVAAGEHRYLLIPVGMLIGYFVVAAEPAVHVLKRQVGEVSKGAISERAVGTALAVGVSVSVGISMLRVLTGLSVVPFLVVGYAVALGISFFVPGLYTGVAFDSGGVASGPMTTTFLLPFAVGACEKLGGSVMTDAFGIVALVAMTPLITIQLLGLYSRLQSRMVRQKRSAEFERLEDTIIYFGEGEDET